MYPTRLIPGSLNRATITVLSILAGVAGSNAKNPIREAFFITYPDALNTILEDADTSIRHPHCGVCHYNFDGGGNRNPYGAAVEAERASNGKNSVAAFRAIEPLDSDGDGFSNLTEIADTNIYANTPTFPGLSAATIGNASSVSPDEISAYLYPVTGGGPDTESPDVTLLSPNGGETAQGNTNFVSISWFASDEDSGLASINIYLSLNQGASYSPIARNLPGTAASFDWFAANRPTSHALIKVEAIDNAGNAGADESDFVFTITSPDGGIAPTTLRDFDLPGSQPLIDSGLPQELPSNCANCHGGYHAEHEPYRNWVGSMMAQASIDPLFKANMSIANQDAPDSGDLCLRCHNSRGWLDGRSTPTDGTRMTPQDQWGVSCDLCHRMVDPVYTAGKSPAEDETILNNLENRPPAPGNGMYVFDPNSHRRGPYNLTQSPHAHLHSPFHREAELCGTCHDVSNPVFERDGDNPEYRWNTFDEASAALANTSTNLMPVERTYSEWKHSAYNSTNGVYAPQFAGNKDGGMVRTCQDCHMPDILGYGADPNQFPGLNERSDLPYHDMTGGSTWLPNLLPGLAGLGSAEAAALSNGTLRAEYMLKKAAVMQAEQTGENLKVTVINNTGHKLPTGYPEGRRMWINLRFYDAEDHLIQEHGGYDLSTGLLTNNTMIYEIHPGIGTNLAETLNLPAGKSFHFVLNNQIYEDNRIPPRGFENAIFNTFGGAPVGHHYDDGQHWDNALFALPDGAVRAHARLFYQSTSKEFIEFLRDENSSDENGAIMYDLWEQHQKCPPVLMTEAFWPENFNIYALAWSVDETLGIAFNSISGYTYWIEYTDDLNSSNTHWRPFTSNGLIKSIGKTNYFTDDFTPATSGETPTNGHRFYRVLR